MKRCSWCEANALLRSYHDEEWGVPLHDDRKQFEYLMMEVMQCGLSWNLMLKKRETSRDLKEQGFSYLGTVTVYSHLQACVVINDHDEDCFRYKYIMENFPVEIRA